MEIPGCSLTGFPFGGETEPEGGLASMHLVVAWTPVTRQRYKRVVVCVVVLTHHQLLPSHRGGAWPP